MVCLAFALERTITSDTLPSHHASYVNLLTHSVRFHVKNADSLQQAVSTRHVKQSIALSRL